MHQRSGPEPLATPTREPAAALAGAQAGGGADHVEFVRDVEPLLARRDMAGLLRLFGSRYDTARICSLLNSPHADARKVAALALALVGQADAVPALVEHLRDADPMVNEMAEHALWSIWFRGGSCEANAHLVRGSECLNDRRVERAAEQFSAAISLCPGFAEAYNQRAIAYYLLERYEESLRDCQHATELMPWHFGAWAGMGHCHAHRCELDAALSCYRRAIAINPHLDCVAEMIRELESRHEDAGVEEWTETWRPRLASGDRPCGQARPAGDPL